jgi:flagellar basal body rod protein FlgC
MGIFDAIGIAEGAMSVHRFRSEVAARNIANINTPGYERQEVDLRASNFSDALSGAQTGPDSNGPSTSGGNDAAEGAVEVARVRSVPGTEFDERQDALLATTEMMRAKSAFELSVKAATLLKSMALSSLEIGRGA